LDTAHPKQVYQPAKRWAKFTSIIKRGTVYLVALLCALIFSLPLIWMVSTSLKTGDAAFHVPPEFIPDPVMLSNYIQGLTYMPFGQYLFNTLVVIIPRIFGAVIVCAIVAYGFSCIEWDGRDALFFLCLATMMIPFAVTMIPLYIQFNRLGWLGTFLPLIAPSLLGDSYYIFLIRQFFLGIPHELIDAARVDGATELDIFTRIAMPLARASLAMVALFQFMWSWGDYMAPLIYLTDPAMSTISLALYEFGANWRGTALDKYTWFMAAITTMTLPVLVIFFLVQRTFIEGISLTGLKG